MTLKEAKTLAPGLYRLHWLDGSASRAAVGVTENGGRWMAPTNWVAPSVNQRLWRMVARVEVLS